MSSLIQSLVDFLYSLIYSLPFFTPTSQTPQKTVLLGLQNSGKSTFLSPQTQHEPTLRPLSKSLTIGSRQFITFDLGGQSNLRSLWSDYVVTGVLVIFVIDVYNFRVVSGEVKEGEIWRNSELLIVNFPFSNFACALRVLRDASLERYRAVAV